VESCEFCSCSPLITRQVSLACSGSDVAVQYVQADAKKEEEKVLGDHVIEEGGLLVINQYLGAPVNRVFQALVQAYSQRRTKNYKRPPSWKSVLKSIMSIDDGTLL
jgi:hypothetical protein